MTTRDKVIRAMDDLPADASIEDVMERLLLVAKIERGLQQIEAGDTFSNDEVMQRMAKWLQ